MSHEGFVLSPHLSLRVLASEAQKLNRSRETDSSHLSILKFNLHARCLRDKKQTWCAQHGAGEKERGGSPCGQKMYARGPQ
jgi:D-Tyr-tRNAtyr deacylase